MASVDHCPSSRVWTTEVGEPSRQIEKICHIFSEAENGLWWIPQNSLHVDNLSTFPLQSPLSSAALTISEVCDYFASLWFIITGTETYQTSLWPLNHFYSDWFPFFKFWGLASNSWVSTVIWSYEEVDQPPQPYLGKGLSKTNLGLVMVSSVLWPLVLTSAVTFIWLSLGPILGVGLLFSLGHKQWPDIGPLLWIASTLQVYPVLSDFSILCIPD